jgi:hypothetical protein
MPLYKGWSAASKKELDTRNPIKVPTFPLDSCGRGMIFVARMIRKPRFMLQSTHRKNCSADFSAKPLIMLMATHNSAQVGLEIKRPGCIALTIARLLTRRATLEGAVGQKGALSVGRCDMLIMTANK